MILFYKYTEHSDKTYVLDPGYKGYIPLSIDGDFRNTYRVYTRYCFLLLPEAEHTPNTLTVV